jgi:hypothetical protein
MTSLPLSLGGKFFGTFECNPARVSPISPTSSLFEDCRFKIAPENSQRCRDMRLVVDGMHPASTAVVCVREDGGRFVCGLKSSSPEAHKVHVEHGVNLAKVPDIVQCMPEETRTRGHPYTENPNLEFTNPLRTSVSTRSGFLT